MVNREISFLLLIWFICVHVVRFLGWNAHRKRLRQIHCPKARPLHLPMQPPGVSILRPMKGCDEWLVECLRSGFKQDYVDFEILLCVDSPDDSAVTVAEQLLLEFPDVNARLLIGCDNFGPNPKINNLVKAYKEAKNDIVWVLDANIWVAPSALSRAVLQFSRPQVALVHHLPVAVSFGDGFGERLEEMYMSTAHAEFYTGINEVGAAPCVMGKSNLYRRSQLDAATSAEPGCGLEYFAKYMAEDHMIAEKLWAPGGRTAMAPDAAVQPLVRGLRSDQFIARRVRWVRLRKYMVMAATLVEPSTDSFVGSLAGAIGMKCIWEKSVCFWWLFLVSLWCLSDWFHYQLVQGYVRHDWAQERSLKVWLGTWLCRESSALPLWLWAMAGRRVEWRGRPFRIKSDLAAEEIS